MYFISCVASQSNSAFSESDETSESSAEQDRQWLLGKKSCRILILVCFLMFAHELGLHKPSEFSYFLLGFCTVERLIGNIEICDPGNLVNNY